MRRERNDLFRFVTRRDVPCTGNACERAPRPSVILRKVTDCFSAERGTRVYAAAASVMDTGRLHGLPALQALRAALGGSALSLSATKRPSGISSQPFTSSPQPFGSIDYRP
jgi:hypothetical protein